MRKVVVLIFPLFVASCSGGDAKAAADAKNPPKVQPQNALPSDLAPSDGPQATGTVEETMDASGYTYVRLKTTGGEVWAAVTQGVLAKGSEITIGNAMWMENFESKTLNRKFDRILFGSVVTPGGTAGLPPGHPATTTAAVLPAADPGDVKVEKATGPGARTVAEIYASKATLKGTEVLVRGKVVKFNAEIMGRNWLHLRDGSGTAEKQDNDITVTTSDMVAKGDVVTIRGKVALDQDFTAGYAYPVMIEGAKVVK